MDQHDALALLKLTKSENVYRHLPTFLIEKQYADIAEVIRRSYSECFASRESILMGVYDKKSSNQFCGLAEIYHYDETLHKVTIGYRLSEEFWGKGLATEIVELLVQYLFFNTDIEMITASHITDNPASGKVLEKNRFERVSVAVEEDWGFEHKVIVDKWCLTKVVD